MNYGPYVIEESNTEQFVQAMIQVNRALKDLHRKFLKELGVNPKGARGPINKTWHKGTWDINLKEGYIWVRHMGGRVEINARSRYDDTGDQIHTRRFKLDDIRGMAETIRDWIEIYGT